MTFNRFSTITPEQAKVVLDRYEQGRIRRLLAKIEQLRTERDEWKERYEAERADHLATLEHTNKMLAEDYP